MIGMRGSGCLRHHPFRSPRRCHRDRRTPGAQTESARPGDRRSPRGEDPLHRRPHVHRWRRLTRRHRKPRRLIAPRRPNQAWPLSCVARARPFCAPVTPETSPSRAPRRTSNISNMMSGVVGMPPNAAYARLQSAVQFAEQVPATSRLDRRTDQALSLAAGHADEGVRGRCSRAGPSAHRRVCSSASPAIPAVASPPSATCWRASMRRRKALILKTFGDGVMSAISFDMQIAPIEKPLAPPGQGRDDPQTPQARQWVSAA